MVKIIPSSSPVNFEKIYDASKKVKADGNQHLRYTEAKGLYTSSKKLSLSGILGKFDQSFLANRLKKREDASAYVKNAIEAQLPPNLKGKASEIFEKAQNRTGRDLSQSLKFKDLEILHQVLSEQDERAPIGTGSEHQEAVPPSRTVSAASMASTSHPQVELPAENTAQMPETASTTVSAASVASTTLPPLELRADDVVQMNATNTCWILATLMAVLKTPGGEGVINNCFKKTDTGYELTCADGVRVAVTAEDLADANTIRRTLAPAPYNAIEDTRPEYLRAFELAAARACNAENAVCSADSELGSPDVLAPKLGLRTSSIQVYDDNSASFDPKYLRDNLRAVLNQGKQIFVTARGHVNVLSHVDADGTLHLTSTLGGEHRDAEMNDEKARKLDWMSDEAFKEFLKTNEQAQRFELKQASFSVPPEELRTLVERSDDIGNVNRIAFLALEKSA